MKFFNGIKKVIKTGARQIVWVKVVQLNSFHGLLESTSFPAFSLTRREPGNEVVLKFVHSLVSTVNYTQRHWSSTSSKLGSVFDGNKLSSSSSVTYTVIISNYYKTTKKTNYDRKGEKNHGIWTDSLKGAHLACRLLTSTVNREHGPFLRKKNRFWIPQNMQWVSSFLIGCIRYDMEYYIFA